MADYEYQVTLLSETGKTEYNITIEKEDAFEEDYESDGKNDNEDKDHYSIKDLGVSIVFLGILTLIDILFLTFWLDGLYLGINNILYDMANSIITFMGILFTICGIPSIKRKIDGLLKFYPINNKFYTLIVIILLAVILSCFYNKFFNRNISNAIFGIVCYIIPWLFWL